MESRKLTCLLKEFQIVLDLGLKAFAIARDRVQATQEALKRPPPATVRAYEAVFGCWPRAP
jgi:hypothetical protein